MDKITFNLNSIDLNLGTRTVSLKHSIEFFTEEQKRKCSYFQDWLNIESMYHYNDKLFYIDSESINKWNLEKVIDDRGNEKQVAFLTPGMTTTGTSCVYKCQIFNPMSQAFDEIECIPFRFLSQMLKVKILIPANE